MSFSNAPCEDQFLVENTCTSIDALGNSFVQWCQMYFFRDFVQLAEDLLYTVETLTIMYNASSKENISMAKDFSSNHVW